MNLALMAEAARRYTATCTCLWSARSATRPGARILGEHHAASVGLAGHRTIVSEATA